jgi:hypothetical protein
MCGASGAEISTRLSRCCFSEAQGDNPKPVAAASTGRWSFRRRRWSRRACRDRRRAGGDGAAVNSGSPATTRSTPLFGAARPPAPGEVRTTIPAGLSLVFSVNTEPTLSPTCVSCFSASARANPTTFGTGRASAASMSTRSTAAPSGTELPSSGEVLRTVPGIPPGFFSVDIVPIFSPKASSFRWALAAVSSRTSGTIGIQIALFGASTTPVARASR